MRLMLAAAGLVLLAGCGTGGDSPDPEAPPDDLALDDDSDALEIEDVEEVGPLTTSMEGVTPMSERVAVLGLLNKRNGLSRELRLRPGESTRVGNVLVRLRACETTAPWEPQQLTGAFVQLLVRVQDPRNPDAEDRWQRVFSGWLYKERPALNVVEHRLYDVWPKACEMTWPGSAPSESAPSESSSAPRSAPAANNAPAPAEPESAPEEPSAESSNEV